MNFRSCFLIIALATTLRAASANPTPIVNQPLVPSAAQPGGAAFTLTVNGTGFVAGSVVNWNGSPRTTHFVNSSQLTAQITVSDVALIGTAIVTVTSPAPGGGSSNAAYFEITLPKSMPPFSGSIIVSGQGGGAMTTGDFNGDGKTDLLVLNPVLGLNTIIVLLGQGDGTFQPPLSTSLPAGPVGVAVGDFDGNGKLDVALSENPSNQVEVALGSGDGTFQPARSFAAGTGPGAGIVAADINGDGKLDLAVADQDDGAVSVLLGNGDGTFRSPMNITGFDTPAGLAVADFNRDGKLDLALTVFGSSSVAVLLGNGDGTFTAGATLLTSQSPFSVVSGDFNGDAKVDVAVLDLVKNFPSTDAEVRVFLGNGDGTFQEPIEYPTKSLYSGLITADINGDGSLDLIAAVECCDAHFGTAAVLLGSGDGSFQSPRYYPASNNEAAVAAGDFFNDGSMDLALSGNPRNGQNVALLLQTSATLLPGSLHFQTLPVGSSSSTQTSTMTNVGVGPLHISGRTLQGANPKDFGESDDCPASLPQGAKCTITVAFSPTSDGTRTAAVNFSITGTPKLPAITLKGIGTFAGLSPGNLDFGSQPVGSTSQPQNVTLTNVSTTTTLTNVMIGVFGANRFDFGFLTNTCGRTLAPGTSCSLGVVFTPQAIGNRSAHIKVQLGGTPIPVPVSLSGTGTQ